MQADLKELEIYAYVNTFLTLMLIASKVTPKVMPVSAVSLSVSVRLYFLSCWPSVWSYKLWLLLQPILLIAVSVIQSKYGTPDHYHCRWL